MDEEYITICEIVPVIDKIIKSHLKPADDFIWGFADLTGLLDRKFDGYSYGISIGLRLDSTIVNKISSGPTPEYYAHYKNINGELSRLTGAIVSDLKKSGIEALAISPSVSTEELDTIYFQTLRTDVSHKMVATRAGLGWIGKTDLLITKKFGPRLRLASILLRESPGHMQKPVNSSRCGKCYVCVSACPAKAANGRKWDITVGREEYYDPWKCRDQCSEFGTKMLHPEARVCGICVEACPVGK
jgi:epoxyqueuosine reductase